MRGKIAILGAAAAVVAVYSRAGRGIENARGTYKLPIDDARGGCRIYMYVCVARCGWVYACPHAYGGRGSGLSGICRVGFELGRMACL